MKIKLNKINKIFIAGFAFLFTLILADCAGDVDQPLMYSPDNGTYIVNGCISFGENSAALSQRTATSSFSVDGLSWEIRVYKIDEKTDSEAYKTFTADSDGKFSVTLDGKGKYDFMALLMKDEVVCASGHAELTIVGPVLDQLKITIKPVEAGEGKINLEVSLDSSAAEKVNNVKVTFMGPVSPETSDDMIKIDFLNNLMSGIYNKTFPVSGGKAQIVYDNFFSGSYLAKLSFDDAAGNTLYSCEQVINVYPGFTTDTWYGSASDGLLTVSNSMINGYGAEIVPNFDKLLLWKHAEWKDGNEMKGDFYYLIDENSAGSFIAPTAPSSSEDSAFSDFVDASVFYTKFMAGDSGSDFTFFDAEGNSYLLLFTSQIKSGIYSTKKGGIFVSDSDLALNEDEVIDFTIDLKNNVAYSLKGGDFDVICRYPNMISSNGANADNKEVRLGCGNINSFVVYDGKAYALFKENDYIIRVFDTYDEEPIKPMIKEYSVNLNDFFNDALGTPMITDMLYQDGRLYLLYKEAFSWSGSPSPTTIGNRGAVIEVNLFDGSVRNTGLTTSALSNTEYKLQGYNNSLMYTDSACTTPYIPSEEILTNANVEYPDICFPNEGEKSFYGPTRFIAVKPKKLVIADEGLAFYTDNELLRYKNVNRVVYVDLENFAVEKIVTLDPSVGLSENETSVLTSESRVFDKEFSYYTKNGSDFTSCFYVGITCGDNE